MNSRFSMVSALSSFSAMLIHDISQPLQTLQLGLDRARANLARGVARQQIQNDLVHLEQSTEKAGALVASLRALMQSGDTQSTVVPILPLFDQIEAIFTSEGLQSRAEIRLDRRIPPDSQVRADPVMLQRILINLVANSLRHFQTIPIGSPTVEIILSEASCEGVPGIKITVKDNGGGFPDALLERVGQPWSTERPDSMGMALMLSRQIVVIWGGRLELFNRTDGVAGATVMIWLRSGVAAA